MEDKFSPLAQIKAGQNGPNSHVLPTLLKILTNFAEILARLMQNRSVVSGYFCTLHADLVTFKIVFSKLRDDLGNWLPKDLFRQYTTDKMHQQACKIKHADTQENQLDKKTQVTTVRKRGRMGLIFFLFLFILIHLSFLK